VFALSLLIINGKIIYFYRLDDGIFAVGALRKMQARRILRATLTAPSTSTTSEEPSLRAPLCITLSYTMLVVDTNILFSSLSSLAAVIKKVLRTIVMPVSVIMELDGLSSNTFQVGERKSDAPNEAVGHLIEKSDARTRQSDVQRRVKQRT
jgi:hypothetical protein